MEFTGQTEPTGPLLMGVVNVTPDSFSDGGRFLATDDAIWHGTALLADGADILDVGGESTRPGATRPVVAEELARVVPVITELAREGAMVSVDTMRADVAEKAVEAGATIINDVSGGLADPRILEVARDTGVGYVCMHWRAHSDHMAEFTDYPDGVVHGVISELRGRLDALSAAGLDEEQIILDPGLGFAKTADHNWELLRAIPDLEALGFPLLIGASRKTFLGALLVDSEGHLRPVDQRESAHLAVVTALAMHRVWGIRAHDVRASRDACKAVERLNP
ncbi:MAG: dihydropteroate synthase [Nocardioides sp.]